MLSGWPASQGGREEVRLAHGTAHCRSTCRRLPRRPRGAAPRACRSDRPLTPLAVISAVVAGSQAAGGRPRSLERLVHQGPAAICAAPGVIQTSREALAEKPGLQSGGLIRRAPCRGPLLLLQAQPGGIPARCNLISSSALPRRGVSSFPARPGPALLPVSSCRLLRPICVHCMVPGRSTAHRRAWRRAASGAARLPRRAAGLPPPLHSLSLPTPAACRLSVVIVTGWLWQGGQHVHRELGEVRWP